MKKTCTRRKRLTVHNHCILGELLGKIKKDPLPPLKKTPVGGTVMAPLGRSNNAPRPLVSNRYMDSSDFFPVCLFISAKLTRSWQVTFSFDPIEQRLNFSPLAHILQILLASKINSHFFCKLLSRSTRWEVGHQSSKCRSVQNSLGHQPSSHVDLK